MNYANQASAQGVNAAQNYAGLADRTQDKPTELDQIGHRLAAAINESCIAIQMLSEIEDKLFGPHPCEASGKELSPVPNGAISQLNACIDALGGKQAVIAKAIQRIRTAI